MSKEHFNPIHNHQPPTFQFDNNGASGPELLSRLIPFDFMSYYEITDNETNAFASRKKQNQQEFSTILEQPEHLQTQQPSTANNHHFSDNSRPPYYPSPSLSPTKFLISTTARSQSNNATTQATYSSASQQQIQRSSFSFNGYHMHDLSFSAQKQQLNAFNSNNNSHCHTSTLNQPVKLTRKKGLILPSSTIYNQTAKDSYNSEWKRQIHIQSEQKRRAQIKDGFDDLRNELPSCLNKKMSKVALLHRTVQHIQHLKYTQITIMAELERLLQENNQLRSILQRQSDMGTITATNNQTFVNISNHQNNAFST
ncbi:hypothetical protein BDF20DRAFT_914620 [Mycotypha africana]|uniref:uncharacterized protein n=1 Tax=Mycotypha africana TaxID=64632 RepID=UPI0023004090|nr:uncharacterized protein BDF20DRAFT_914620 [Mycotypha africana]KAI8975760.1 hypothetical protein BDF20DRAFT_914620 [Mycotypha africana]